MFIRAVFLINHGILAVFSYPYIEFGNTSHPLCLPMQQNASEAASRHCSTVTTITHAQPEHHKPHL